MCKKLQNDNERGYVIEQRGMYYCARLLSEQLGVLTETTDYSSLKKVYSLWVVGETEENKLSNYYIVDQEGNKDHSANLVEMSIVRLSKNIYETEHQELFDFLHAFFDRISLEEKKRRLKKYFAFDENEQLEEGVDTMCNLSEGIYNIGKEEGKLEAAKIMIESGMDFNFVAKKLELPRESQ